MSFQDHKWVRKVIASDDLEAFAQILCEVWGHTDLPVDLPWKDLADSYFGQGHFRIFDHLLIHCKSAINHTLCRLLVGKPEYLVYLRAVIQCILDSPSESTYGRLILEQEIIPDAGVSGDIDTLNLQLLADGLDQDPCRYNPIVTKIYTAEGLVGVITPSAFFALDQRLPKETQDDAPWFAKSICHVDPSLVTSGLAEAMLCSPRQGEAFGDCLRTMVVQPPPAFADLMGRDRQQWPLPTDHEFRQLFELGQDDTRQLMAAWKKRPHYHPRQLHRGLTLVQTWLLAGCFWEQMDMHGESLQGVNFFAEFLHEDAALAFYASLDQRPDRAALFMASQGGRPHPNLFLTYCTKGRCIVPLLTRAEERGNKAAARSLSSPLPHQGGE